jgi:hypothetical protein
MRPIPFKPLGIGAAVTEGKPAPSRGKGCAGTELSAAAPHPLAVEIGLCRLRVPDHVG